MNSYLKFLSRNKLYTLIEASGLIVSLACIVMIVCYVWQQYAITRESPDCDRIFAVSMGGEFLSANPGVMAMLESQVPDIEAATRVNGFVTPVWFDGNKIPGNPECIRTDPAFFDFMPVTFLSGSPLVLEDRSQVVLGEAFARKISPDADPVGKRIILSKDTCIIGGILRVPERSLMKEQAIYRFEKDPDARTSDSDFIIPVDMVLVKLRKGADTEGCKTLIDTLITREFGRADTQAMYPYEKVIPLQELYFSPRNTQNVTHRGDPILVYVLIAIGILLLVSALFNYINLSVALSGGRAREMAIRTALGESRGEIARRYILESLSFVAVCFVLALGLAKWLEPVFNRYVAGDVGLQVSFSGGYLAVYALLVLLVGVVSGLIPAMLSSRYDPVSILKGEQRRHTKSLFSKIFIIVQNVLSVALISLALVMELQYAHLLKMPLGASVDDLYYISSGTVGDDELARKPYVERMGFTNGYPGHTGMRLSSPLNGQKMDVGILSCDTTAFEMYGFEIVKDYGTSRMGSLWFTESAARAYGLDEDNPVVPDIFKFITSSDCEVGGIIRDFAIMGPSEVAGNQIGVISMGSASGQSTRLLKLNRLDAEVRADLQEIARQESLRLTGDESYADRYGPIPELIAHRLDDTRNFIRLIELFMLIATLISLLGLVAMSAYYTRLQTRDIAVRKVFGASVASETVRSVKEYLILVAVAILIGVPVAIYFAGRYLERFWYRIEGYGWIFAVAALIALSISLASVLWQTLRAARTNPATELKKE